MKILFCTDGSKISYNALKNSLKFVKKETVYDIICAIDWSFLPDDIVIEETGFLNSCKNIADEILNYAENIITERGITVGNKIKTCANATESILEHLESEEYNLVVLGSHGKKGLQRWMGSVSREVLDSTNTPVYISKNYHSNNRVLFATDGSTSDSNLFGEIINILDFTNSEISICMVNESPDLLFLEGTLDSNWMMDIKRKQEFLAIRAVENLKQNFENKGLKILNTEILCGVPATSIIEYSKEKDLVILGAKYKNKIQSFLLDSVSRRVVENINSDAIIIKKIIEK